MPSETTPKLNLPLIAAQQAQKHVTHNEALRGLDALVQATVKDRDLAAPPATPAEGDCYIVAVSAGGDWAGHDSEIAEFRNGGWVFHAPGEGWLAFVQDENTFLFFDGTAWQDLFTAITVLQSLLKLGINTTADDTNRLAVKSDAVLFSHDDVTPGSGDVRFVVNKKAAAGTASLMFQTEWSGRAEMGLAGDDDFRIKVSKDGGVWQEALRANRYTGRLIFPQGIDNEMTVYGGTPMIRIADRGGGFQADAKLQFNPTFGGTTYWQHFGFVMQEWDETASPPAPAGPAVGIGFSLSTRVPFFANGQGVVADILTSEHARVRNCTLASLPDAADAGPGAIVFVSDESGGATLAFSDGANWRRVQDRAIVG